jgi:hypothetical protein
VWHAFGIVWGGTGATNCCNSQIAAVFASLPDGKMRIKKADKLLEIDVVQNTPKVEGIEGYPHDDSRKALGYAGVFWQVWIQSGSNPAYKTSDGKRIWGGYEYSSPAYAMRWLQVGEPVAKWGDKASLTKVRMGDDACWWSHNWLVGDIRYEVTLKGRKTPVYVDQSDFARGEHPDPQPTNKLGGHKMTKADCTWVELHEEEFEARLKHFLEGKSLDFEGKNYEIGKIEVLSARVFSANGVSFNQYATAAGVVYEKHADGSWTPHQESSKRNRLGLGISRPWMTFAGQIRKDGPAWGFARWYDNAGGAELKPSGGSDPNLNARQPEEVIHG